MTPADLGIAAAIHDEQTRRAGRLWLDGQLPAMWLVTKPTADSELADVLWGCDWVSLGHAFKGGLEGSEVVGLFDREDVARSVATSLLMLRDSKR